MNGAAATRAACEDPGADETEGNGSARRDHLVPALARIEPRRVSIGGDAVDPSVAAHHVFRAVTSIGRIDETIQMLSGMMSFNVATIP